MSKNDSNRVDRAKCPFYRRDRSHSINCEGLVTNSTIKLIYQLEADCTTQFDTFCAEHYDRCEIYCAVIKAKYEE